MEKLHAPKPALPLLVLLALASLLGVAVAVALAGVTMLLAAPAYADEGGALLLERPGGLARAPLVFAHWDSQLRSSTRIVEAYQNPFDEALVGVYLRRLPSHARLERLEFASHDAAQIRHAILMRWHADAIVERIASIAPGETIIVELEYRTPELPMRY